MSKDYQTHKIRYILKKIKKSINQIAFSSDGVYLTSLHYKNLIYIRDLKHLIEEKD